MWDLMYTAMEYSWDFAAKLSLEVEEHPRLSLEIAIIIAVITYWVRRTHQNALNNAQGQGKASAYKDVATQGQIIQTGTGTLLTLVTILSMLVILLLVFFMLGAS